MQSENFRALVKPIATVHRVIWLAFLGAVPAYVVVAYVQLDWIEHGVTYPMPISFTIPLVIISLLTAVLAPLVPRLLFPDSQVQQVLDRPPDLKATITPDEQRLLALVGYLFVPFLVRLAFNESIGLYGFVLAVLSRSFVAVLPFAIVSLALNWMVPLPLDEALKRIATVGPHDDMPIHPR